MNTLWTTEGIMTPIPKITPNNKPKAEADSFTGVAFAAIGNGELNIPNLFACTFETKKAGNPSEEYLFVDRAFMLDDVIDHCCQARDVTVGVEQIGLMAESFRIETVVFTGAILRFRMQSSGAVSKMCLRSTGRFAGFLSHNQTSGFNGCLP